MTESVRMYRDGIDLSAAVIHSSPDVRGWPIGPALTAVEFKDGSADQGNTCGIKPIFDRDRKGWINFTPPGWEGPLQFTLWIFVRVNGVWHGSGLQEFWKDREWSGDVVGNWHNWTYNADWWPEMGRNPPDVGEQIGVMVVAGDQRHPHDIRTIQERSQVALVTVVANGRVEIEQAPDVPVVPPILPPILPPPPIPPPIDPGWTRLSARLDELFKVYNDTLERLHKLEASAQPAPPQPVAWRGQARVFGVSLPIMVDRPVYKEGQ